MNHIYRVIWNEVTNSFVAVSEIAKARGKPASTVGSTVGWAGSICPRGAASASFDLRVGTKACPPYAPLTLALALTGTPAHALDLGALPTGGSIAAGTAAISQTANALTVQQSSQRAAIDWQSFNIGSAATVNFNQPNANAVALNRITGNSATEIYGKLNANGQVFFSNPNGMLFAKGAQVNVGGILATTMSLGNEDFMAGNYRLTNPGAGAIRNEGLINALGSAALIGNSVENAGQIVATTVTLAAGNSVAVDLTGDGLIRARVEDAALKASIENSGSIEGAQITLTAGQAKDAIDRVVNNTGIIRATGLSMQGGVILLEGGQTLNSGTLDASASPLAPPFAKGGLGGISGNGGTIQVLGNQVGVMDGATITANGAQNGGTILIGGDYQGKLPLPLGDGEGSNAQATYIAPTATLSADGGILTPSPLAGEGWGEGVDNGVGNGGKIIVWADDTTRAYGSISARGGANSGNGGFIETSGHYLDAAGIRIDATALNGKSGSWLLDPINVTITATADAGGTFATGIWTPTATGSTITAATIQTALNAGTSVTIDTTGGLAEAGDITVSSAISKTTGADATLTLNAHNNINLNASITSTTGQLNMVFNPDSDTSGAGSVLLGTATLNANGGTISAAGKTVNLSSGNAAINSAMSIGTLNLSGGTLSGTGAVTVSGPFNVTVGSTMKGTGTLTTQGSSTIDDGIAGTNGLYIEGGRTWVNSGTLTVGGDDWVYLGYINGGTNTLTNAAGGVINLSSTYGTPLFYNAGTSTFNNQGTLNQTAAGTHAIAGSIAFNNTGTVNVNAGTLSIAGNLTQSGIINVLSGATFQKTAGFTNTGTLSGAGTIAVGTAASKLINQGNINPGGTGTAGTLSITGDVQLSTGSNLNMEIGGATANTQYDVLTVSGTATLGGTLSSTLSSTLINGFTTNLQSFDVITAGTASGSFATSNLPFGVNGAIVTANTYRLTHTGVACSGVCWDGGAGTTNWADVANWSGNALPGSADVTYLNLVAGVTVNLASSSQTIKALNSDANNHLTIGTGGALTISGTGGATSTLLGNLTLNGGTLTAYTGLTANDYTQTAGTLNIGGITLLKSAGSMTVNGAIAGNVGGTLTLQAINNILLGTGGSITGTVAPLNVILDSDSDGLNGGAISLAAGTQISSNGGNITLGGGSGAISAGVGFAQGTAAFHGGTGVYVGGNLTAGGGNIVINGIADAVTNGLGAGYVYPFAIGVEVSGGGAVSTTGAGTITLAGQSMNAGSNSVATLGVSIGNNQNGTCSVSSVDGDILINGTSGRVEASIGVFVDNHSTVQATGLGSVTINGTAGDGVVAVNGTRGINVVNAGAVRTNSGTLTLYGVNTSTGGSRVGVDIDSYLSESTVTSTSGQINIIGDAVSGVGAGIWLRNPIGNGTSGDILIRSLNGRGFILLGAAINTTGNVTLDAVGGGAITQTNGSITAVGLRVLGDTSATASLTSATNHVTTLAGNLTGATATMSYADNGSFNIGSLTTDDIGLGATTTTNGLNVGTAATNTLTLNAVGTINASNSVGTGIFTLSGGTWNQVAATLPSFSANDFRIAGGTFIRALGGDGTAATPYQLADIYGVQGMGSSGMLGKSYTLANNIDATGTVNWNAGAGFVPVGGVTASYLTIPTIQFSGTFDGLSHTISNLTINRPTTSYVGLFGYTTSTATISNVGLVGGAVSAYEWGGFLAGENFGAISNSYATGNVTTIANYAGGLVGINYGTGTVTDSYATGNVSSATWAGGLTAWSNGMVSNSYATGNVTGTVGYVGGLMGENKGTLSNSYATGNVVGPYRVGGLVGYVYTAGGTVNSTINNSYATGSVTSTTGNAGGLVGDNEGAISNSYATGSVSGAANVGGFVGNSSGSVTNSFWDTTISGESISAGGTGLTTAQMMQLASYTGWNIANTGGSGAVWRIYEGHTAPLLASFLTPLTLTDVAATYNGTAQSGTTTALAGVLGTAATGTNAGNYSSGYYSTQQGYDLSGGSLTINAVALNVIGMTGTRAYDGTANVAANIFTLSGLVGGQTLTLSGTGTVADKNVGVNKPVTLGSLTLGNGTGLASNYTFTGGTQVATITAAPLTLSTGNVTKTYDGLLTAAGAATVTGGTLFGGDTLSGGSFAFTDKNVGSGNKTVTTSGVTVNDSNGGANYAVTYANNMTSTITPAPLTVTANNASRIFGAANPTFTSTITGYVNGENASTAAVTGAPSLTTTANTTTPVGTASIVTGAGTLAAGNYAFTTLNNGVLTIAVDQAAADAAAAAAAAAAQAAADAAAAQAAADAAAAQAAADAAAAQAAADAAAAQAAADAAAAQAAADAAAAQAAADAAAAQAAADAAAAQAAADAAAAQAAADAAAAQAAADAAAAQAAADAAAAQAAADAAAAQAAADAAAAQAAAQAAADAAAAQAAAQAAADAAAAQAAAQAAADAAAAQAAAQAAADAAAAQAAAQAAADAAAAQAAAQAAADAAAAQAAADAAAAQAAAQAAVDAAAAQAAAQAATDAAAAANASTLPITTASIAPDIAQEGRQSFALDAPQPAMLEPTAAPASGSGDTGNSTDAGGQSSGSSGSSDTGSSDTTSSSGDSAPAPASSSPPTQGSGADDSDSEAESQPAAKPAAVQTVTVANTTVQKPADQIVQTESPRGQMLVCR
ncbi:MAG: filamentous hemagglutinin N-terminal domain-containing protein [Gallionella sp.]|nr:filamentous hemagglutinin N-terminal domain-containing protein [Gallionella sp.]